MNEQIFISILLAIVGFVGVLMVKQLMKIADSVNGIQSDLKVLANDHTNLKDEVIEVKHRVLNLERNKN